MIVTRMQVVKQEVLACFARFRQLGMVTTCIDVDAAGTVEHVGTAGELADTDEARCVAAAVQSARFLPHDTPWSLRYPYVLR